MCLSFDITSALAIFQKAMNNMLANIPDVMINDILVMHRIGTEHLINMEVVFQKFSEANRG